MMVKVSFVFRDSNLWSDVSSIGPSVSVAGSVNEDDFEVSGNRKENRLVFLNVTIAF